MVKTGYKQTEIGVIPEDWEAKQFQDVIEGFSSGMTPYRGIPEYYRGNIRWITSGELNYNIIYDTEEHITKEAVEKTNLKILPKGTFLMAITGLEATGTRGSCGIVGEEATTNQSCMALYGTKQLLIEYLFHYYVKYGDFLAFRYCQGTKQQSYTAKIVKILPIVYPTKIEEQKAIASALSDVDGLITSLEKLIAKKESIKTATMQQLLTGKKRLEGFHGEWEEKSLFEFGYFKSGSAFPIVFQGDTSSKIPFYKVSDMNNKGNETFMSQSNNYISEDSRKKINAIKIDKNSIVFAKIGAAIFLERKKILSLDSCLDNNMMAFVPDHNICDFRFIHYLFLSLEFGKLVSATALPSLSSNDIGKLQFYFPTIEEQQAISQILSDMDNEIKALKTKLTKTKAIKDGMMSELLSGKTRLKGVNDE